MNEGQGQSINREQFLKDNKLGDALDIFVQRDITIEELLDFEIADLTAFAADIGLDVLQRNRFIKALKKLKPEPVISFGAASSATGHSTSSYGQSTSSARSGPSSGHVIVSPEEHDSISSLYQRYDDTAKLILELKGSFSLLEKASVQCKQDVNDGFKQIVASLENKKVELKEEGQRVKNEKKEKLMAQLESLKEYCSKITDGKKKYEKYIGDPSMDIHKRKNAVLSMIESILNDKNVTLVMVTQPKIAFNVDNKAITKFVESLEIDDMDQPFPPMVTILKCDHSRVQLTWRLDPKYQTNNSKSVLMFAVEWCKLPKKYIIKDEDSKFKKGKSKRKKNKKKKKKKKRKRKNSSDTSDSDDSDKSSDDDSDSSNDDDDDKKKKNKKEEEKPAEGNKTGFGMNLKKKMEAAQKKNEKVKAKSKNKKKKKKKRKDTDSDTDSDNSDDDGDSDSDDDSKSDDSDSKSDSDSDDSSKSSGSDSDSDTDSEEEEKSRSKKKKMIVKELTEWKEADDMDWEIEEIRVKKKESYSKKYKYAIDDLRDSTAYAVRVRGKNSSGWGLYSTAIMIQTGKMTIASKLLKSKEVGYLMKLLPKKLRTKKFKLLFRATKDGFTSYQFHAKCDNKGQTVTLVQSNYNHIFGGYTSVAWNQNVSNYSHDQKAFVFLLRSSRGKAPQKWGVKNAQNAIYNNASYGPTFGAHDFYLCNNCNTTQSSSSSLGQSYSAPNDYTLLAGAQSYTVKDFEVWQIK